MNPIVIHIGDTHLSQNARQADRIAVLEQILARAEQLRAEQRLAAIVWPGDLYHARSTVEDRNTLVRFVMAFGQLAPVIITPGNHDQPGDLDVLARLHTIYPVIVQTTPGLVTIDTATPDALNIAIYLLPYPHKAGLVAAGVEHQALGQTAETWLDTLMIAVSYELQQLIDRGVLPMFATHINVGGALSSAGQPQIGKEIELPPALLDRLPASVAVLGNHIHKHQQVGRLVYAGSIARMDYGEQEPKGYLEWAWHGTGWTWTFMPVDTPRQVHVEGTLTREGFTITSVNGEPVSTGPGVAGVVLVGQDFDGADVRCRYHFVKAELRALDLAHIHAAFAGVRSLSLDPVPQLDLTVRAPEIAAAETLEDKVRAYAARVGVAVTPGLVAKVAALQAQDGQTVLQQVASAMDAEIAATAAQEVA